MNFVIRNKHQYNKGYIGIFLAKTKFGGQLGGKAGRIDNMIVSEKERLKLKYKALRPNTLAAREKLRELANREIVTDKLESLLRKKGW